MFDGWVSEKSRNLNRHQHQVYTISFAKQPLSINNIGDLLLFLQISLAMKFSDRTFGRTHVLHVCMHASSDFHLDFIRMCFFFRFKFMPREKHEKKEGWVYKTNIWSMRSWNVTFTGKRNNVNLYLDSLLFFFWFSKLTLKYCVDSVCSVHCAISLSAGKANSCWVTFLPFRFSLNQIQLICPLSLHSCLYHASRAHANNFVAKLWH